MPRPVSPLLHDYKQASFEKPRKSRAPQWFAVGVVLPVIATITFSLLTSKPEQPPIAPSEPAMSASNLPASPALVPEPVLPAIETPPAAEPEPPEPEYETLALTIRKGDTLDGLFRKNNLNLGHLAAISRLEEARQRFRRLKPGDEFEIQHENGNLVSMYSKLNLTSGLSIARADEGFTATIVEHPVEKRTRKVHGVISSTLFEAGADAGLTDRTVMNLAGIFAWDVDFVLDIREGDSFYVLFEEIWQDGAYVADGEIVAAEFNNDGDTFRALRFIDKTGRSDYFTPEGRSVRKAFLRAPVDFRVSSSFNPNRLHPVLKTRRPHRGVDYAAPRGTPIKASGDGKVIFRGTKSGYGNTVILQHGGNITTLYAHMNGFVRNVRVGTRVRQGQTIGFVGDTGLVTGVHLHYEYRLNGVHRNPRTVELPDADPIADEYRKAFMVSVEPILKELDQFKQAKIASVPRGTQN